jgi:hypothetical protein
MDTLQQRIIEIAQQIPDYIGYQQKERRREINELVRRELAIQYGEQRNRLARLQRGAPLDHIVELENLDQKLLRLIARLQTATGGYAGWFDAAQIVESDLDQLTQFDQSLAAGVKELQAKLDAIGSALKAKTGIEDAIAACADTLDALNAQYDQRDQFVALGKRPTKIDLPKAPQASPLGALEAKPAPPAELVHLAALKVNDAVTLGATDYLVAGKITYNISAGSFWAYWLQDGDKKIWLRVGPGGETATCQEIELRVPSPMPESLQYAGKPFARGDAGTASVIVEGAGGVRRGSVMYARYRADNVRLWLEDFGTETRAMLGEVLDARDVTVYRK